MTLREFTKATSLCIAVTVRRECFHNGNNRSQRGGAQDGGPALHPIHLHGVTRNSNKQTHK